MGNDPQQKRSYYQRNRDRILKQNKQRFLTYPEVRRGIARACHLKVMYNTTREAFEALLAKQGGCCAICGTAEPGGKGTWQVDHDHSCCAGRKSCGKCIRGLLCVRCNTALGLLRDSIKVLERALIYLKGDSQ